MIITVIPLIKLPRKLVFFDYEVPAEITLEKFSIVLVPWRKSKIFALVVNLKKSKNKKDINLKKIIKTINQGKSIATLTQFNLIMELAKNFLVSPSIWWKNLLPKFPKINKTNIPIVKNKLLNNKNNSNNKTKIKLEISNTYEEMINSITTKLNLNNQQLILCPELLDIDNIYNNLPDNFKKLTTIYHKGLKNKELITNYFKVLNNEAKIIIGTKLSFLLPFFNLNKIHVFKSENYGFASGDQNPRYNLDQIYDYLAKFYQPTINLYSLSPWVDTYAYLKKSKQEIVDNQSPLKFRLIDMTLEKKAGNFSYISWPLEQAIKENLKQNKKCILLVNRKGFNQKIYCQDCGWSPTCNKCEGYLKIKNRTELLCGACQKSYSLPVICNNCKSVRLKSYGLTNQSLVEILKNIFERNDIYYIDSENKNIPDNINLFVATKYFIPRLNNKFGLIAFVDGDQELISHNYRSFELAWQLFNNAFRVIPNSQKIIQTKKVDHFLWNYLTNYSYHKFWLKEMNWRKKMNFPPYSKIIKLIIKENNLNKVKLLKEDIISNLNNKFINIIAISNSEIVFNFLSENYQEIISILSKLPESIMIEFNPYEI